MPNHLTLITGASRGLGHAMAVQRLREGHHVLTLARHPDMALPIPDGALLEQWSIDLASPLEAARRLEHWLGALDSHRFASATLINNAALLTPPGPIGATDAGALSASLRVGLEAPVLLARAFLRATDGWPAQRKVLNISSGLGRFAMAGSAAYCAVKAGLDHFSRALALDEALKAQGARVASLAPGVIDTDMQVQLRGADPGAFPDRERFLQLKSGGQLASPEAAAARVLAWLDRADFGAQPVADVRDA